jgi:organic hydroperoxide reductase OsmC/OhrA
MAREHRFPVRVVWEGGRLTTAYVNGKHPLSIATPPEFRGTNPDVWSPEDVFVAAVATCLAVTIDALAGTEGLELENLDVHAEGVVGRRPDGRYGFVRISQVVELEVPEGTADAARAVVAKAEDTCLISVSLDLPVETSVLVHETVTIL